LDSRIEAAHSSATSQLVKELEDKKKTLQDKLKALDALRGSLKDLKATMASGTKALSEALAILTEGGPDRASVQELDKYNNRTLLLQSSEASKTVGRVSASSIAASTILKLYTPIDIAPGAQFLVPQPGAPSFLQARSLRGKSKRAALALLRDEGSACTARCWPPCRRRLPETRSPR